MKTETETIDKPAQFQTPHEAAATASTTPAKAPAKRTKKNKGQKAKAKTAKVKETKSTERDAFGGRIGTRMSKINQVVIKAGAQGATIHEVAKKTGEPAGLVSAQLSWIMSSKKLCTRKEETNGDGGKKTFRYFAKNSTSNT